MKVLLVLSVLTWTLVQNTAGNLLGGGGYVGGYYPQYPPIQPQPPIQPVLPLEPETVASTNLCEIGAAAQEQGNCQGYSIQICPFGVGGGGSSGGAEIVEEEKHKIAEIIDVKLIDEITGELLGEEVEEIDVTGQYYPYSQYGGTQIAGGGIQIGGGGGYYPPQFPRVVDEITGGVIKKDEEVFDVTSKFYSGYQGQPGYSYARGSQTVQRPPLVVGYFQRQQQAYTTPSYQSYSAPKYQPQPYTTTSYSRPETVGGGFSAYNRLFGSQQGIIGPVGTRSLDD